MAWIAFEGKSLEGVLEVAETEEVYYSPRVTDDEEGAKIVELARDDPWLAIWVLSDAVNQIRLGSPMAEPLRHFVADLLEEKISRMPLRGKGRPSTAARDLDIYFKVKRLQQDGYQLEDSIDGTKEGAFRRVANELELGSQDSYSTVRDAYYRGKTLAGGRKNQD